MSNYHLKPIVPPSVEAKERKAARKKIIDAFYLHEAERTKRLREKMREAYRDNEEYRDYSR